MKKKCSLNINSIVQRKEGLVVSDMRSEKVMFSLEHGKYYNLGEVGGEIWELIKEPMIVRDLVSILVDHFHVTHPECERHVLSFLKQLYESDLIYVEEERIIK